MVHKTHPTINLILARLYISSHADSPYHASVGSDAADKGLKYSLILHKFQQI
jgi:hypothetical protein